MVKKLRTFTVPVWQRYLAGSSADLLSRLTGRPGILSRDRFSMPASATGYASGRAAAELGFRPRPRFVRGSRDA